MANIKLRATASFSGLYGSAGVGQVIEVGSATAKLMLADHYPVEEVRAGGGRKRAATGKRADGGDAA